MQIVETSSIQLGTTIAMQVIHDMVLEKIDPPSLGAFGTLLW